MRNLSIGKQIGLGFGVVVILLLVVVASSLAGISTIVDNGKEVIDGNKLRGEITQREVDHLNWANKVSAFITDEHVKELTVETDHTRCAFGLWFYGEGRKRAQSLIPDLKPMFDAIEEP